uniref:RRM domain-containing protein n=1 Tax=Salix viminalis TaxID=40686 RepID=A0A6N2NGS1_SALVM
MCEALVWILKEPVPYNECCCCGGKEIASIKVIRNKQTGLSEGYDLWNFLHTPQLRKFYKLWWAFNFLTRKHLFHLRMHISLQIRKSCIDANTGRSKVMFVRFEYVKNTAMTDMNGSTVRAGLCVLCCNSRILWYQQQGIIMHDRLDLIFVGGLDPNVTDEDLKQPFSQYGEIVSVKIPVGKGCGNNAEEALQKLNGTVIGKQTVRLSWGRNPANKQDATEFQRLEQILVARGTGHTIDEGSLMNMLTETYLMPPATSKLSELLHDVALAISARRGKSVSFLCTSTGSVDFL